MQLPYHNTFASIWEYRNAFLSREIDVFSYVGPVCPICGKSDCYREITPYKRYAIDLFPTYKKEIVPIARALCNRSGKTFSLLPIQLIPYHQYTMDAVIRTLLLGLGCREAGQAGFWGACCIVDRVDPESRLTPWLMACWLTVVVRGLQRAHAVLRRLYTLDTIRTPRGIGPWEIAAQYGAALLPEGRDPPLNDLVTRYVRATSQFLFGTPSQERSASRR